MFFVVLLAIAIGRVKASPEAKVSPYFFIWICSLFFLSLFIFSWYCLRAIPSKQMRSNLLELVITWKKEWTEGKKYKFYVVNIYDARGLSNTTHACLLKISFSENWIEEEKNRVKIKIQTLVAYMWREKDNLFVFWNCWHNNNVRIFFKAFHDMVIHARTTRHEPNDRRVQSTNTRIQS